MNYYLEIETDGKVTSRIKTTERSFRRDSRKVELKENQDIKLIASSENERVFENRQPL